MTLEDNDLRPKFDHGGSAQGPRAYFDHNATSPFSESHWQDVGKVLFEKCIANASSPHEAGRRTSHLMSLARRSLAESLCVPAAEIIFLSSATEANNTIIKSILDGKSLEDSMIVTSAFEHPSVIAAIGASLDNKTSNTIETHSHIPVSLIGATKYANQSKENSKPENELKFATEFLAGIRKSTILANLMSANNETGHVFPVRLIGDFLHYKRYPSSKYHAHLSFGRLSQTPASASSTPNRADSCVLDQSSLNQEVLEYLENALSKELNQEDLLKLHFHVDATQSFGKIPPSEWISPGIDSLAISGHKIAALPGSGALVVRRGRNVKALLNGGGQERFRRAGTENLPAIVSLGMRAREVSEPAHWMQIELLRRRATEFETKLRQLMHLQILSDVSQGLPNTVHALSLSPQMTSEDILIQLDLLGFAASSGSACSSGTNRPSSTVLALGFNEKLARNALRFSFSKETTQPHLDALYQAICSMV